MDTSLTVDPEFSQLGFNGAMPFQAWILRYQVYCPYEWTVLQWGHALSGMDTCAGSDAIPDPEPASMGPCPFRHGYGIKGV